MTTQIPERFESINGRIRRKTYLIRGALLSIPIVIITYTYNFNDNFALVLLAVVIALSVFLVIQFVKRLHDIDMNGWYWLISLIPIVNLIFGLYVVFKEGTTGPNKYGNDPKNPSVEIEKNQNNSEPHKTSSEIREPVYKSTETKITQNYNENKPVSVNEKTENGEDEIEGGNEIQKYPDLHLKEMKEIRKVILEAKELGNLSNEEAEEQLAILEEKEKKIKQDIEKEEFIKSLQPKLDNLKDLLNKGVINETRYKKDKEGLLSGKQSGFVEASNEPKYKKKKEIDQNGFLVLKYHFTWYIPKKIRDELLGVEIMGLSKFQNKMRENDLIVKSKTTKRIEQITEKQWRNITNKDNYLVLIDSKLID